MTYGNGIRLQQEAAVFARFGAGRDMVFVNVDNAAQWVEDEGLDRDDANLVEALPIVTPPWSQAWYEYGIFGPSSRDRVGVPVMYDEDHRLMHGYVVVGAPGSTNVLARWTGKLDEDGRVVGGLLGVTDAFDHDLEHVQPLSLTGEVPLSPTARSAQSLILPVLAAITFLHCKNVEVRDVEQRRPSAKRKPGKVGPPRVTYKTLVIGGITSSLRTEGGIQKNGAKKAFHICRGHFAHYTPENPLFGKVTGTFWRHQHTRGSRERGEVVKSYAVEVGRE